MRRFTCTETVYFSQRDDPICDVGVHLAETLGVPYQLLTLPVPEDEEWAWNDVVEKLGWGKTFTLGARVMRPVLECSTTHITLADSHLLGDLTRDTSTREWIHDTGVGFMIRLDAVRFPLLKLKMEGLSGAARWVIWHGIRQANISMIHFSAVGDSLDGFQTFDW